MSLPTIPDLFDALDATWPAEAFIEQPPWTLRRGAGGGQRVSAATATTGAPDDDDITAAEDGMRALAQHPLFMLRPQDEALDARLEARGYDIVDPVAIFLVPLPENGDVLSCERCTPIWPASPEACNIWRTGGIGPARIAVMERVLGPKTALICTDEGEALGTVFVAKDGDVAMLHALEVSPDARRQGVGTELMNAASLWGTQNGANWLALMVTRANTPANALYRALGMRDVGGYHYRRAPQAT